MGAWAMVAAMAVAVVVAAMPVAMGTLGGGPQVGGAV